MKVFVIGNGGREHALVKKLQASPKVDEIWAFPGNAGIAQIASIPPLEDNIVALADFAAKTGIDLTVVGPEAYLAAGIVDVFRDRGLTIFGPTQAAARVESSKAFAKELMQKYGIPTAAYKVFDEYEPARRYIEEKGAPLVIKADGLAAGKGVTVAPDVPTALTAARQALSGEAFGEAGRRVVIEEFMQGQEVSILALCDGQTIIPLAPAQDHKAVGEGDRGPNTGGMGAYSPVPAVDDNLTQVIYETILEPTVAGLKQEGVNYTGVLYAGLMLTDAGPRVVEFNCRFGDPETQAILPRLQSDLVDLLLATCSGTLHELPPLKWDERSCLCVIAASGGYPGSYQKGFPIAGIETAEDISDDIHIFHAGTTWKDRRLITAGGRVLGVSALGHTLKEAQELAYQAISQIHFQNIYYRRDIGKKAVEIGKKATG